MLRSGWASKNIFVFTFLVSQIIFLDLSWSQCTSCSTCPPPIIDATTKQVPVNGSQGLTASGGAGGPYTWSMVSGAGSISGTSGTSINYSAPSSNANCAGNPVIRVTDSCGASTDMSLAVYAASGFAGYYVYPTFEGCAGRVLGVCYYQIFKNIIACDGNFTGYIIACSPGHNVGACTVEDYYTWADTGCGQEQGACLTTNCTDGCAYGYHDTRTSGQLSQGCCPLLLIPCLAEIKNFTASATTITQSSGDATTISATIPTPSGGGTVNWTLSLNGEILQQGTGENVSVTWNGRKASGEWAQPGPYTAVLQAQTSNGSCSDSTTASTTITVKEKKDICLLKDFGSQVNVASGNLYHDQILFRLPRSKFQQDFVLAYNSFDGQSTPLGRGWTHTYNFKLLQNNNNTYTVVEGDGKRMVLSANSGRYTPEGEAYPALTVSGNGTYTLEYREGIFYQFNANKIITAVTDRKGNSVAFGYNGQGDLTTLTDPSGRVINFTYNNDHRITIIADPNGNTHSFTYNNGRLAGISSQINGLGTRTWSYSYDANGFLLTKTDPGNYVTTYEYDTQHRVSKVTDPETKVKTIAYNVAPSTSQITEKDGGVWTYKYNSSLAALTEKTDPLGNITQYAYDSARNLVTLTDPRGKVTSYYYDGSGNVTMISNPAGYNFMFNYNAFNQVTRAIYPGSAYYYFTYDSQGNPLSVTEPEGNATSFTYDAYGNRLTQVNALNQTTTYTYNTNYYLTSITEPNGAVTTLAYDGAGNMTSLRDPLNNLYTSGIQRPESNQTADRPAEPGHSLHLRYQGEPDLPDGR